MIRPPLGAGLRIGVPLPLEVPVQSLAECIVNAIGVTARLGALAVSWCVMNLDRRGFGLRCGKGR